MGHRGIAVALALGEERNRWEGVVAVVVSANALLALVDCAHGQPSLEDGVLQRVAHRLEVDLEPDGGGELGLRDLVNGQQSYRGGNEVTCR